MCKYATRGLATTIIYFYYGSQRGEKAKKGKKKRKKNRAKHALVWHIIKKKRHHKECGTKVQPSIKGDGEYYTENMMSKRRLVCDTSVQRYLIHMLKF